MEASVVEGEVELVAQVSVCHACLQSRYKTKLNFVDGSLRTNQMNYIHSKKWIPWIPDSAENFEFSAERLSENVKTINSAMCVEITVKRHLPYHSTLIYIHYLAIVLVAINTLLDLF